MDGRLGRCGGRAGGECAVRRGSAGDACAADAETRVGGRLSLLDISPSELYNDILGNKCRSGTLYNINRKDGVFYECRSYRDH